MLRALDQVVNREERDVEVGVAVAVGLSFDAARSRCSRKKKAALELSWCWRALAKKMWEWSSWHAGR